MGNDEYYRYRFRYCEKDTVIKCELNEPFKDVLKRYVEKTKISPDDFYFIYMCLILKNYNFTFKQINKRYYEEKETLILVIPKNPSENENQKNGKFESEIMLRVEVLAKDVILSPKDIYFLTNEQKYLKEINKSNTTLLVNEKKQPFKRYFIPEKEGQYLIRLKFKKKLKN